MKAHERELLQRFFSMRDDNGIANTRKVQDNARIIRRLDSTPKDKSFEVADSPITPPPAGMPLGVVEVDDKLVGLGIHIFNEDVYPIQQFEIYLRDCDLVGDLDLSGCTDLVFVDVYRNRIRSATVSDMPALRILGLQGNEITQLDARGLSACQGIDIGNNRLASIDVTGNPELVELYVNDNELTALDTTGNRKLKYLRCQNNRLKTLDVTANPELRHLYATGNPLASIRACAPGSEGRRPLMLTAEGAGCVGLSFNPLYNAQWKETGEWEQSYHAYPAEGCKFLGWFDADGELLEDKADWIDTYGTSRIITARFDGR